MMMHCCRCGKNWPSVLLHSHLCAADLEASVAPPEPRASSMPYEPTEEQALHSPILAACHASGMTESQTIEMLWRAHRDLQWRMMRMMENETSPRYIVTGPIR